MVYGKENKKDGMMMKGNIIFLYGTDEVALNIKKEEHIKSYFKENSPDVTVIEAPGSYDAYVNALEGQSLFANSSAVVIRNPFFLKKVAESKKEEKEWERFFDTLKNLSSDTLLIISVDGKPDGRMKITKALLTISQKEECNLLKPEEGAGVMIRMLMNRGKRIEMSARMYLEAVVSTWSTISKPFLETECDKIILMAGDAPVISKRLLEYALPEYMDRGIFKFTEALLKKRADVVLQGADHIFTTSEETLRSIGFLAYRFRQIKIYREMKRNRRPSGEIQKILGFRSQWHMNNFEKEIGSVTEYEAEWFLVHLFRYQLNARSGGNTEIKDLLLTYCLWK